MRLILFLFLTLGTLELVAQTTEEQLAAQFFGNKEFDKAADAYEKLLNKNPGSGYFYENLLQCYLNTGLYEDAEKLARKQQKRFPKNQYFKVDQGFVFASWKKQPEADKIWNKQIAELSGDPEQASELSSAFQKRSLTDWSILSLETARKKANSPFLFCLELARLYGDKRETQKMVNEYLNALQDRTNYLEDIQGYLQLYLEKQEDYELVKSAILKKTKEYPGNETYAELLIWLYVQRKDFNSAFMQARALDKRNKEEGNRVMQLAGLALQNDAYDASAMMYNFVISLGSNNVHYLNAKSGTLNARTQKVLKSAQINSSELLLLESDYYAFLNEFGKYYMTAKIVRELARLEAYQLHKYDTAIGLFNELVGMERLENSFKANCKLELGDIYILKGEEWEAMLLYGQVDKDYKEDPLGQEAKFRNARLSYYMGEFEWAKAQLDVLKTATTQLISNNAIELSLLIQDNTVDSNVVPLAMFAKADLNFYQNRLNTAISILDSINLLFPRHSLDDDILFKRAEIALSRKEFDKSVQYLELLLKEHNTDILGDNALFLLAEIQQKYLNNPTKAKELYEQFLEQYSGSFFIPEVRKRFRTLRGDVIN